MKKEINNRIVNLLGIICDDTITLIRLNKSLENEKITLNDLVNDMEKNTCKLAREVRNIIAHWYNHKVIHNFELLKCKNYAVTGEYYATLLEADLKSYRIGYFKYYKDLFFALEETLNELLVTFPFPEDRENDCCLEFFNELYGE